jgi:hypothetical protein
LACAVTAPISFQQRLTMHPDVSTSDLHGELVLLNFATETYYGLDEVGARIFTVLTERPTIEAGLQTLHEEFDVEEERLRADVTRLVGELLDGGLVELHAA